MLPITLTIKADPPALAAAEAEKTRGAGEKGPFRQACRRAPGIDRIVSMWLRQILSRDPETVIGALGHLAHVSRLPAGGGDVLKQAAEQQCHPKGRSPDAKLLRQLALTARGIGSREALEAVVTIIRSEVPLYARQMAIADIVYFPYERVDEILAACA